MIRFLTFCLLIFFNNNISFATINNPNYQYNFAMFCKSYSGDLEKSLNMYQSVEKYAKEKYPFFIVIPSKDFELFNNTFTKAMNNNIIKNLPTFLTEEDILKKCNILNKVKQSDRLSGGWAVQQMVKMCIHSTNIAKDYITIDSDVYFIKDFDKNIFYKDGVLKLVGRKLGDGSESDAIKYMKLEYTGNESAHRYQTNTYVRYVFRPKYDNGKVIKNLWYDFVSNYAIWSSDILYEMVSYTKQTMNFDIADLINISPWEMQWYGQYIQNKHPELFILMPSDFRFVLGYANEERKGLRCLPTKGYKNTYLIANQAQSIVYTMPDTTFCRIKSAILQFINNL